MAAPHSLCPLHLAACCLAVVHKKGKVRICNTDFDLRLRLADLRVAALRTLCIIWRFSTTTDHGRPIEQITRPEESTDFIRTCVHESPDALITALETATVQLSALPPATALASVQMQALLDFVVPLGRTAEMAMRPVWLQRWPALCAALLCLIHGVLKPGVRAGAQADVARCRYNWYMMLRVCC